MQELDGNVYIYIADANGVICYIYENFKGFKLIYQVKKYKNVVDLDPYFNYLIISDSVKGVIFYDPTQPTYPYEIPLKNVQRLEIKGEVVLVIC